MKDIPSYEDHVKAYALYEKILDLFSGYEYRLTKLAIAKVKWQMMQLDEEYEKNPDLYWE